MRYCGYDEERSKVFYSSFKHPLPTIFQGTSFKKHIDHITYFTFMASSTKLFQGILSVLTRLYLNFFFFSLLNEVNSKETQQTVFRQETWTFAYDLIFYFCLNIDINYFDTTFQRCEISIGLCSSLL